MDDEIVKKVIFNLESDMRKNKDLYLKILRIGQTVIDLGLSYNLLKRQLEESGYDFSNSCIEVAVKQWFFDSFHHKGQDGKLIEVEDLDEHLDCRFVLKGDAALKLADYETARTNLKIAKKAMTISILAMFVSIFQEPIGHYFKSKDEVQQNKTESNEANLSEKKRSKVKSKLFQKFQKYMIQ